MRNLASLMVGLVMCLLAASDARAQALEPLSGLSDHGLCGLRYTASPVCPESVGISGTSGYGLTESVGPIAGAHHRILGQLGLGVTPHRSFSVALRLDGRLDLHPGSDYTGTGDPRLFLRAGHAFSRALALGAEAVLWFPGTDAPSFAPKATTADLKALLAFSLSERVRLLANVGYRLDQSARSAPSAVPLRSPGDRMALGLSDSDAVLLALGLSTTALDKSELFLELSADLLVGEIEPLSRSVSPLRATVGARAFLGESLQGELTVTASLSKRPTLVGVEPLIPIEPRVLATLGLRYGFDLRDPPPAPPPVAEPVAQPAATTTAVQGTLVDEHDAPLPDVRVTLQTSAGATLESVTDGEGRYSFGNVPFGAASVEASAAGFESQRWELEVAPEMPPVAKRSLTAKQNLGTLRVLTRTFASEPIKASVLVRDARGKKVSAGATDAQGLFELDLPPGRYAVTISTPGYAAHRREVQLERYGVTILNVDLREQK